MVKFSLIRESFGALRANILRSFLTILGMVMGVMSVIAIVATVEGMQQNIEDVFASMGPKTFMVSRIGFGLTMSQYLERLKRKKLTRELIPLIEEGCPDCEHVGAEGYARASMKYGSARIRRVSIEGNTPNMLDMKDLDVAQGRFLTWEDDRRRGQVVFIGDLVREKLFGEEDPLGKRVRLGNHEFTVIGVAEKLGGMFGEEMDEFATVPLSTLHKLWPRKGSPVNLVISSVTLDSREIAMDQVRVVLRSERKILYEQEDDFTIFTPDAILSFINDFTRGFRVILISLPLLSIVVGGIVIMNIMMISVTERTREIGIRKALGARRGDILVQFLYESLILSIVGGAIGIIGGIWLGKTALSSWMDIDVTPTTLAIILGFGISTAVGLFFGIYPATRAARLDPVEALSHE